MSAKPTFSTQRADVDHANPTPYTRGVARGLTRDLVEKISAEKNESDWMLRHRLAALDLFNRRSLPTWGPDLTGLKFQDILYYADPKVAKTDNWGEVPAEIRRVYDRLGIPEAERKVLAGVGAQYESAVIYHRLKEYWGRQGVIFLDMDDALRLYPDLVARHFMKIVRPSDHAFAALHGAVWSGGTFLYVPAGVKVSEPLQAYFRMNAPNMGQFEHTLIIVEEGAEVHYIEGCSAPKYGSIALHAGCVEIAVGRGAKVRYSSVENWSRDTFNLNTKRAVVQEGGAMEWTSSNMGSGTTMLYPCSILAGEGARSDHLGLAFANAGQWQDVGAKVIHAAPNTTSSVVSKSISKGGGNCVYRGTVVVSPDARNATVSIQCDALLLDAASRSDTIPDIRVSTDDAVVAHEARVGRLSEEDIFYLMSRGLSEDASKAMIVNGFLEPIVRSLPLEYAVEMNRLIEMEMEGSVG